MKILYKVTNSLVSLAMIPVLLFLPLFRFIAVVDVSSSNIITSLIGGIVDVRPEVGVDSTEKFAAEKAPVMGDIVMGDIVMGDIVSGGIVSGDISEVTRMLTYGYVKLADGLYVQVRCYGNGETVEEVEYRDTASDRYAEFNDVYDLSQYMPKNADGT